MTPAFFMTYVFVMIEIRRLKVAGRYPLLFLKVVKE